MPGQCYSCRTDFSVFKKEHSCKNCGYAFCTKCLHPKTIPVPKRNNAKHHVCNPCYKILTGEGKKEEATDSSYDVPQAYIKRMEALKEREAKNSEVKREHGMPPHQPIPQHLRNLNKADRDIAMRLERLKETDKPTAKVTNEEINSRLANLQGRPYQPEQTRVYQPPDRRLQQEQIDDLLDEIGAEVDLDAQAPDPVKDIETKLNNLRSDVVYTNNASKQPDKNNLNKLNEFDTDKSKFYNKNIGVMGEASGSSQDNDLDEIHRLMVKAAAEVEVDANTAVRNMQKDNQLMERLKDLQKKKHDKDNPEELEDNGAAASSIVEDNSDEDEDAAANRIIQRYLEELKIDDVYEQNQKVKKKWNEDENGLQPPDIKPLTKKDLACGNDSDDEGYDPDELPYCCICTEDATMRCLDCDRDLFCPRCFRECHQKLDIQDHRSIVYKLPKDFQG